jgi:hypothetical protein
MKLVWLLVGVVVFMGCTLARAGMTVYATDGLARVRPNDPPLSAPAIHIRAARNGYEPFR